MSLIHTTSTEPVIVLASDIEVGMTIQRIPDFAAGTTDEDTFVVTDIEHFYIQGDNFTEIYFSGGSVISITGRAYRLVSPKPI